MEVDTHEVFHDKLTYIYVEIPKFDKKETELITMYDKWMYVMKNLSNLMQRPIAANLLSLGVPMKTIIQASGLSEEEIKNMMQ